jgi:hypothetical protein
MTTPIAHSCPGCGHASLSPSLLWKAQPVILNYRFPTPERACDVPRRDMDIRQCCSCGLIFNATVDLSVIPYDELYENSQVSSPVFLEFMQTTAQRLADTYQLHGGLIFEVGCGKGGFLRLVCGVSGAQGIGYDTSCEELEGVETEGVRFFKRYAGVADVPANTRMIACRHVVEHIPRIGDFMKMLADFSRAGGGSVVYIETPRWEWIVENQCFWDVFYEHCNYFPMPTLRYLAELAGMEVLEHRAVFNGQYQALEARFSNDTAAPEAPGPQPGCTLEAFSSAVQNSHSRLEARLVQAGASAGWAIWGAGAKGVSLANAFPSMSPRLVVDSNPAKQGSFIPGTAIPVVSPDDARLDGTPVVLIANPNYTAEILRALNGRGLHPQIVQLS